MAARGVLVEQIGLAVFLQPRGELARVLRADAVVLGGRPDVGLGIGLRPVDVGVGRDAAQERRLVRVRHRPVLAHPRRARRDLFVTDHVEQRHLDGHRLPQLGMLGELHAHQEAAVRAAVDAELVGAGQPARDEVAADRGEIVVDDLALGLEPGIVPRRPELTAAADVGEDERAALLQPQLAKPAVIAGGHRDVEAAVRRHDRRRAAVQRRVGAVDDEIGDFRAVARRRLELLDLQPRRVEACGRGAHLARGGRGGRVPGVKRRRLEETGDGQEHAVVVVGRARDPDRGVVGQRHLAPLPAVARGRQRRQPPADVVGVADEDAVLAGADPAHRLARRRREDQRGRRAALLQLLERHRGDRARGHRAPRVLRRKDHAPVDHPLRERARRHRKLLRARGRPDELVAAEEVLAALDHHQPVAGAVGDRRGVGAELVLLGAARHLGRGLERRAALHHLDHERVARRGHRARPPVAADEERVLVDPGRALLGRRQLEAAFHEPAGLQVELTIRHRVLAALGQRDEAVALLGQQAVGALPHPFLAFRLRQRVEVDQGLPGGVRVRVVGLGRPAPQALRMIGVAPEVEDAAILLARHRDAVLGGRDRQRVAVEAGVARIVLQARQRARVLGLDPGQRLGPVLVLQPHIGIVGHRRALRHQRRPAKHGRCDQNLEPTHESLPDVVVGRHCDAR